MADLDLHKVAFPTLDDLQVVTLAKFGTRRVLRDGDYLFTLVSIGNYELTAEHTGFSKFLRKGITLDVNQNGRLDVTLQVGTGTEVVEVSGNVTQVDTVSATLGKVETEQRILDLPLVERNTLQLGLLQAGVFTPDQDDGSGNPFSVSGQRSESLTFLIEGLVRNLAQNPTVDRLYAAPAYPSTPSID